MAGFSEFFKREILDDGMYRMSPAGKILTVVAGLVLVGFGVYFGLDYFVVHRGASAFISVISLFFGLQGVFTLPNAKYSIFEYP